MMFTNHFEHNAFELKVMLYLRKCCITRVPIFNGNPWVQSTNHCIIFYFLSTASLTQLFLH